MQRTSATRLRGAGWSRRAQAAAIRAGMSPGGRNDGSSGSMTGPPGWQLAGGGEQRRQVLGRALELPRPERLLEQPQAHHVAKVADAAVDAALVREVGRAALLGQDRLVELDADERPRPAGDVRERDVAGRHADDGRRGVVRSDQRQDGLGREAGLRADVVAQRTDHVARAPGAERTASAGIDRDSIRSVSQVRRSDVEERRRRGVRDLRDADARQPVAEQVGDEQHRPRGLERRRAARRRELVDGVEREELEAGPRVEVGRARRPRGPAPPPPSSGRRGSGTARRAASPPRRAARSRRPTNRPRC